MKVDGTLVVVWWLWLVPALLALPLPVEFAIAVGMRGLESVQSSGIGGGGFALLNLPAVLALVSFPPLLVLSPLYALLVWKRRKRGVTVSARFWIPVYGSALLAATLALMVVSVSIGRQGSLLDGVAR
jgi:hypothetical protein